MGLAGDPGTEQKLSNTSPELKSYDSSIKWHICCEKQIGVP